jgi:hypothetical protein
MDAAEVLALPSAALKAACELVEIAVGPAEVEPLPARVPLYFADHLDPGGDELCAGRLEVVDFEKRNGTVAARAEKLVVAVARAEDLDAVVVLQASSAVASSSKATRNPRMSRRNPTISS